MANYQMTMGQESTIKQYIANYNSEEIVSSAYYLKKVFESSNNRKMLLNFDNLVIKYMPELKDSKVKITLNNEEYEKYKYNPKLLSYDIYGTTELWFLILEANELYSATQFSNKTIYLFRADIVEKMCRILNLEMESKNYNEEEISSSLLE